MPATDPADQNPPQRPKPPRRDPRLDAQPQAPGRRSPPPDATPAPPRQTESVVAADSVFEENPLGRTARSPRMPLTWLIAAVAAVVVLSVAGSALFFSKNQPENSGGPAVVKADGQPVADQAEVSELREPQRPVICRINTPEPGFVAFIDEQPVRDEQGKLVLTPCEVGLEKGRHVIRVAKKGWNDLPRTVDLTAATDFNQEPTYEPFAEKGTTFSAPYLESPVGQPFLLQTLVFQGRCQDPFVSANGCEIWYAASGPEGMGIYYSTRATPYDEWETPSLLVLSRGADLPASPSATEDGLLVGYTVPGKSARVWRLSRNAPEESFDDKKPLHYLEHGDAEWPSAQLSSDARRLYWFEIRNGKTASWMASREEVGVEFSKGKKLALPGGHSAELGDPSQPVPSRLLKSSPS